MMPVTTEKGPEKERKEATKRERERRRTKKREKRERENDWLRTDGDEGR